MAIRLVPEDHMPEAEVKEAMIVLAESKDPIEAHYHKCAQHGDIHVCVNDTHKASALMPTHDDDEDDEDEDEGTRIKEAKPAPTSLTRESLLGKPLRLVINDGRDSEYNGHFDDTGLFIPAVANSF